MKSKFVRLSVVLLGVICSSLASAATSWSKEDYDLFPGDFNGDQVTDILFLAKEPSMPSGVAYSYALVGPAVTLGTVQTWSSNYLGLNWNAVTSTVVVGDFNGDGRSDVFLQSKISGDSALLFANSNTQTTGQIFTASSQMIANWSADRYAIQAGDFNGDGKADLFLQSTNTAVASAIYVADMNGQFTSGPTQLLYDGDLGFKWSTRSSDITVGSFGGSLSSNGRPTADLLIRNKPTLVTIDYDISIPIMVYKSGGFGLLFSDGGSTPFSVYSAAQLWNRIDANGVDWSPQFYNVVVGDFYGTDGIADVILQSKTADRASYLIARNSGGGPTPFSAAASLATNVAWSADQVNLLAGSFSSSSGQGLYFQSTTPAGNNSYSNSVLGSSIATTAHDGSQHTNIFPTTVAGRMLGSASVTNSGAGTYSVPLDFPAGIAGLTPRLAITYNSSSTPGVLGPHWDVSGLSSIRRCVATYAQDGAFDIVTLLPSDRLCLDGNKMRGTSGTYGTDNSQYRLELDNFSQITAHGTAGSGAYVGPAWFEVKQKNGLIYEYGTTPGASVSNPAAAYTTPIAWMLSKIRDRSGNYILFTYVTTPQPNGGIGLIDTIEYAGNDTASVSAPYRIKFNYSSSVSGMAVPLLFSSSVAGGSIDLASILSDIQISFSSSVIRSYNFGYLFTGFGDPKRPLLKSIQECGASISECLPSTNLDWSFGTAGWSSAQGGAQSISATSNLRLMDMNGDGRDDAVFYDASTSHWMIMWGSTSGLNAAVSTGATSPIGYQGRSAGPTDVDGDGRMDLLVDNGGTWYMLRYTSNGAFSYTSLSMSASGISFAMADINGDGYQDLLSANGSYIYSNYHAVDGSPSFSTVPQNVWSSPYGTVQSIKAGTGSSVNRATDFDGDGRQDISVQAGSGYYMLYADGATLTPRFGSLTAHVFPINRNYDACSDTVIVYQYQPLIMNSGCWRDFSHSQGYVSSIAHAVAIDWNGTGTEDTLFYGTDPNYGPGWYANYPAKVFGIPTFLNKPVAVEIDPAATQIFAADINGDALHDLAWVDPTTSTLKYQLHSGTKPELLTSVTDGFGHKVSFDYQSTRSGNCTTSNDGSVPATSTGLRRSIKPRYVVCGLTSNDGIGGNYVISYSYTNDTQNVQGRGGVGFEQRAVTDGRNGISQLDSFYHSFPYTGMVSSSVSKQSNGTKISESNVTVSQLVESAGYFARYFPYASGSTEDTFETGGSRNGDWITRKTSTVNSIDGYGNVTDFSVTTIDKDILSPRYGQSTLVQTIAGFSNDSTNWCHGYPTSVQTTTTLPDGSNQTKKHSSTVVGCRVKTQTVEPDVPALKVETTLTYDDEDLSYVGPKCGNISQNESIGRSSTGAVLPARTVKFNYGNACRFPELLTDALGNQSQRGYRYDLGLQNSETDVNGLSTSKSYDNFGRPLVQTASDGTSSISIYTACNTGNNFCGVPGLRMQVQTTSRSTSGADIRTELVYSDSLGRIRFARSQRADGNFDVVQTTYDAFGRTDTQSVPYTSTSNGYTQFGYDLIGRRTSAQLFNANNTPISASTVAYAGRTQTSKDPRGYDTVKLFDVTGQLRKLTDPAVSAPSSSGSTYFDYTFEAGGILKFTVTDAAGNLVVTRSNLSGFKTQSVDPDLGTWSYEYDSFGELTKQTDAKNQVVTFAAYDALGRQTVRRESEGSTVWVWGVPGDNSSSAKYVGQLRQVCSVPNQTATNCSGATYTETYAFDAQSRPSTTSIAISGDTSYTIGYTYSDSNGLLEKLTYPASTGLPLVVKNEYSYGIQTKAVDYSSGSAGTIFWQLNAADAMGNPTDESMGNGILRVTSNYDPTTGLLATRQSGTSGSTTNRQNLSYLWDASGNLKQRTDNNQSGLHEDFYYDEMNRLDYSQLNGTTNLDVTVNAIGNLTYKSDVGGYTYPSSGSNSVRPHAATSAGSNSYVYDANGNMSTRNGSQVTWTSYNLPTTINGNGQSSTFSYAPDRSRYKQVGAYSTGTETTYYIGGVMEKTILSSGVTAYRHYITGGSNAVVHTRWSNGAAAQTFYVTADSLGSSSAIVNESGALVVNESFSAYGARRGANWSGSPASSDQVAIANSTRRGYTGHEHLDNVGLIHMNGRVQDPVLGRFISADPGIDEGFESQGLNRYSYVGNRPLSYADPTGFVGTPDPNPLGEVIVTGTKFEPWNWIVLQPNFGDPLFKSWTGPQFVQAIDNGFFRSLVEWKDKAAQTKKGQKEAVKNNTKSPAKFTKKNVLSDPAVRAFIRSFAKQLAKAKLSSKVPNVEKWVILGKDENGNLVVLRAGLGGEVTTSISYRGLDAGGIEAVAHVHPLASATGKGTEQYPYIGDYLPTRNLEVPNLMIGGTGDEMFEIGRVFWVYTQRNVTIEPPSAFRKYPYSSP